MGVAYANEQEKIKGYTYSRDFLKEIQQYIKEHQFGEETPNLNQIEDAIIAYEKLK